MPPAEAAAKTLEARTETSVLLNGIAAICVEALPSIGRGKQKHLDSILRFVTGNMRFPDRLALATTISAVGDVPSTTLDIFLSDAYEIAQPIIEKLDGIDEAFLIRLASKHGEKYLLSIARRQSVPIPLTDIIVDKGLNPSVFTVASNRGARFSVEGFGGLVVRAQKEVALQDILASRSDVPTEIIIQLKTLAASRPPKQAPRTVDMSTQPRQGWGIRGATEQTPLEGLRAKLLAGLTK